MTALTEWLVRIAILGGTALIACTLRDMRRVLGPTRDSAGEPYVLRRL